MSMRNRLRLATRERHNSDDQHRHRGIGNLLCAAIVCSALPTAACSGLASDAATTCTATIIEHGGAPTSIDMRLVGGQTFKGVDVHVAVRPEDKPNFPIAVHGNAVELPQDKDKQLGSLDVSAYARHFGSGGTIKVDLESLDGIDTLHGIGCGTYVY